MDFTSKIYKPALHINGVWLYLTCAIIYHLCLVFSSFGVNIPTRERKQNKGKSKNGVRGVNGGIKVNCEQ